jgi:cytoplasmic polyadenylation element-binding protein
VDWPHKAQSKAYFPPKGYAFLLFREEASVHRLVKSCLSEEGKLYMYVSSLTQSNKKVQIRSWRLSDSDFIMDHTQPIDARKTIFIGGVPRPLKACELADIFNARYGNVCYAGIDCDPDLKYPKGAGRVTFSSRVSFMSAVSCRFLQVTYGDIDKKVEVKPYVLDDQICDECHGINCGGRYAPYFCGNIHCLRYYCEHCWAAVHSAPGTQNHRCFIKENGDRPRAINLIPSQPRLLPKASLLAAATSCRH